MNKHLKSFLIPVAIAIVYFVFFQNSPARRFHNKLVRYQNEFVDVFDEFVASMDSDLQVGLEKLYQKMIDQANESLEKAEALETFEGGEEFHDNMLNLLAFYKEFAENECHELVLLKAGSSRSAADKERIQELARNFNDQKKSYEQIARESEEKFAQEFDIEIE